MSGVRGGGLIGSSRREEAEGEGRRAGPEGRGPCGIDYAETWRGRAPIGTLTRGARVPEFGSERC